MRRSLQTSHPGSTVDPVACQARRPAVSARRFVSPALLMLSRTALSPGYLPPEFRTGNTPRANLRETARHPRCESARVIRVFAREGEGPAQRLAGARRA